MDEKISRWSQLVFLDHDQVESLHHREVLLGTRSGPSNRPLFMQKEMATWEALTMISEAMRTRFPEGYWPKAMDGSAQYNSIDAFTKSIYPIWRGIAEKDKEREEALPMSEIGKPGSVMFEILTMHKQDLAIFNSGIKPARIDANQETMNRLRRKDSRAGGY